MSQIILRPASQAMDLERLGAGFSSRLSFMRTLVRHMVQDQWAISYSQFKLDDLGYGHAIFDIKMPHSQLSLVVFSQYLAPEERNDRVIAEKWDLTMTLVEGEVDDAWLERLSKNVPLQEAGRIDSRSLCLSRGNRSARIFDSLLQQLRSGVQPDPKKLAEVGYLYRTTAVYGSGKFGACDWDKIARHHPDLARPFSAEMLVCYLLRQFSLDQLHHMVHQPDYPKAVDLDMDLQRYLGIGNSTGLGMAPYLINHPLLMSQWIGQREQAYAEVLAEPVEQAQLTRLKLVLEQAMQHVREVSTFDAWQSKNNVQLLVDAQELSDWLSSEDQRVNDWRQLHEWAQQHYSLETQELLVSLLLELYPDIVNPKEDQLAINESLTYDPTQSAQNLADSIQESYDWVFDYDFTEADENQTFWYYSQEKMEPRLGKTDIDDGAEVQMFLGIAKAVQACHNDLLTMMQQSHDVSVAEFLLQKPMHLGIVNRIATMAQTQYGEIRANLLHKDVLPMHLLRCKLAFFGVSKFDPKSALWVRNTMFQGAPVVDDLKHEFNDDWYFPVAPIIGSKHQPNA
ncbi:hypothetical protein N8460_01830 [Oceanospirillaceae bacterium]|nr:hypothetical protein [Oceanospirillaceae bacterium]MDC1506501.1 hypothetical protein [Oceanospirillaceae bacterium]MDO7554493.1 hypothetical protein [Oceanospirillaceae bacterium]MDO7574318.1 hypothetical protein [Oceanospirillaceae bacterium]